MISYTAARRAIEAMYDGRCTIYEQQSTKDEVTKVTKFAEVPVVSDKPCRISYQTITVVGDTSPAAALEQRIKLLMAPEITVKPGSKIKVTQSGVTDKYVSSGLPAVYPTHQEIILKAEGWA